MEKKDLDISLAILNSVVSRKHCGNLSYIKFHCSKLKDLCITNLSLEEVKI